MPADPRSRARDRVLFLLKRRGPHSAAKLAERLGITSMAVRQHLTVLEKEGLVAFADERRGVGRPTRVWELTPEASERFPDSHADLTVELLDAMRATFGDRGLDRLVRVRTRDQERRYRERMPPPGSAVEERVAALAVIRREEGYMAEWSRGRDGSLLLVENHCPICAAARVCQGLCRQELDLFQRLLGPDVHVERSEHILAGARRCAYRIAPERSRPPSRRRRPRG